MATRPAATTSLRCRMLTSGILLSSAPWPVAMTAALAATGKTAARDPHQAFAAICRAAHWMERMPRHIRCASPLPMETGRQLSSPDVAHPGTPATSAKRRLATQAPAEQIEIRQTSATTCGRHWAVQTSPRRSTSPLALVAKPQPQPRRILVIGSAAEHAPACAHLAKSVGTAPMACVRDAGIATTTRRTGLERTKTAIAWP